MSNHGSQEPWPRVAYVGKEVSNEEATLLISQEGAHTQNERQELAQPTSTRLRASGFAAVALCILLSSYGLSSTSNGQSKLRSIFQNEGFPEAEPNAFGLDPTESTFELYGGGEGNGICKERTAVSQEYCYGAAFMLGKDAGMTFANDELNVGSWDFAPCGCFIYDAGNAQWIDYKDPSGGNCQAPLKGQLVCKNLDPPTTSPTPGSPSVCSGEINNIDTNPDGPLGCCEGDCDKDSDCASGMKCFQRNGNARARPLGCTGTMKSNWDYCYIPPSDTPPPTPVPTRPPTPDDIHECSGEINNIDTNPDGPLGCCEGDCDKDTDCAPGLICFQRNGNARARPLGCTGTMKTNWDYCAAP